MNGVVTPVRVIASAVRLLGFARLVDDTCQNTRRLIFLRPGLGARRLESSLNGGAINLDETGWDERTWIKRRQLEARVIAGWHLADGKKSPGMWRGTMPRRYAPGVSIRCTNYPYMPLHSVSEHVRHTTAVIHEREPRVCASGVVVSLWPLTTLCSKVFLIMDSCCLLTGGSSRRCLPPLTASGYTRRPSFDFLWVQWMEPGRKRLTCEKIAALRICEFNRPGLMIAEAVAVNGLDGMERLDSREQRNTSGYSFICEFTDWSWKVTSGNSIWNGRWFVS